MYRVLSPPPNEEATCELPPTGGDDVPLGEYIRLVLSLRVQKVGVGGKLKWEKTGARLKVLVDKNPVYDQELVDTGGDLQTVSTDKFEAAKNQQISMVQQSGDSAVEVEIDDANIRLASTEVGAGGGGGGSDGKGGDDEKGGDDGKGSGGSKGDGDSGKDNGGDDSGKDNGGKDDGGDSGSDSGSGSGSGSGDKDGGSGGGGGSGDNGSGDDGSKGDSGGGGSGSGEGNGDDGTGSGSPSGTGDEGSSPSATAGSEGAVNAAGKLQMMNELLMYVLPLAAAFMG
jgi:hypothetical protein